MFSTFIQTLMDAEADALRGTGYRRIALAVSTDRRIKSSPVESYNCRLHSGSR